jgi:hypothetical protein
VAWWQNQNAPPPLELYLISLPIFRMVLNSPSRKRSIVRVKHGILLILAFWPAGVHAQGTIQVRFERPAYFVEPNQSVSVNVVIDPVPANGIFSYGVRLGIPLVGVAASSITVPPPLDFNGVLGAGALKAFEDGFAGVKGTVDFSSTSVQSYPGSLLSTILLADMSGYFGAAYELHLEFFRTVGPSETLFVDGLGTSLDDRIIFGSTVIMVIPEPSTGSLFAAGLLFLHARGFFKAAAQGAERFGVNPISWHK